ncbi:MAG: aldo/keto reductase [Pirellulaceae bacterium]
MPSRPLGKTGLQVSPIGFGAFKIGRNQGAKYPCGYDLPDESSVAALLHGVLDLGVTHIDTAPAYGLSEERIGRHLAARRSEFVLSTKVGETFEAGRSHYAFDEKSVRDSIHRSLQRLRCDVLDIALIHAPADDVRVLTETDVAATLVALKSAGDIRAIGLSGKTVAAARLAQEWADVLMVEYHSRDTSHAELIAEAAERGIGVIIKKGLASGHLPAAEAIPFALHAAGVTNLVVGGLSLPHMAENVRLAEDAFPSTSASSPLRSHNGVRSR